MQNFQLFIDDDRYSTTTMRLLVVRDGARACEVAREALGESAHHLGVELFRGGQKLLTLGSCEGAAWASPSSPPPMPAGVVAALAAQLAAETTLPTPGRRG